MGITICHTQVHLPTQQLCTLMGAVAEPIPTQLRLKAASSLLPICQKPKRVIILGIPFQEDSNTHFLMTWHRKSNAGPQQVVALS